MHLKNVQYWAQIILCIFSPSTALQVVTLFILDAMQAQSLEKKKCTEALKYLQQYHHFL